MGDETVRLKSSYAGLSDEQIKNDLALGPSAFRPGVWDVLCAEAEKRSINTEEFKNTADSREAVEEHEFKKVFETYEPLEASFIESVLEGSGIKCAHLTFKGVVGPYGQSPIPVLVNEADEAEARNIVKQYIKDCREKEEKEQIEKEWTW